MPFSISPIYSGGYICVYLLQKKFIKEEDNSIKKEDETSQENNTEKVTLELKNVAKHANISACLRKKQFEKDHKKNTKRWLTK